MSPFLFQKFDSICSPIPQKKQKNCCCGRFAVCDYKPKCHLSKRYFTELAYVLAWKYHENQKIVEMVCLWKCYNARRRMFCEVEITKNMAEGTGFCHLSYFIINDFYINQSVDFRPLKIIAFCFVRSDNAFLMSTCIKRRYEFSPMFSSIVIFQAAFRLNLFKQYRCTISENIC